MICFKSMLRKVMVSLVLVISALCDLELNDLIYNAHIKLFFFKISIWSMSLAWLCSSAVSRSDRSSWDAPPSMSRQRNFRMRYSEEQIRFKSRNITHSARFPHCGLVESRATQRTLWLVTCNPTVCVHIFILKLFHNNKIKRKA